MIFTVLVVRFSRSSLVIVSGSILMSYAPRRKDHILCRFWAAPGDLTVILYFFHAESTGSTMRVKRLNRVLGTSDMVFMSQCMFLKAVRIFETVM